MQLGGQSKKLKCVSSVPKRGMGVVGFSGNLHLCGFPVISSGRFSRPDRINGIMGGHAIPYSRLRGPARPTYLVSYYSWLASGAESDAYADRCHY